MAANGEMGHCVLSALCSNTIIAEAPGSIKGFQMILKGELDDLPEQAFYLVGNIEEAISKAETLK